MSVQRRRIMDSALSDWPLIAHCGACGGPLEIYPYPAPEGSAFCLKCSPSWLKDFLVYATKDTQHRGYKARTERGQ